MPLIILGGGGHSRVLQESLRRLGAQVLAVYDQAEEDKVLAKDPATVMLVNALGGNRSTLARAALFQKFKKLGYRFASVILDRALDLGQKYPKNV